MPPDAREFPLRRRSGDLQRGPLQCSLKRREVGSTFLGVIEDALQEREHVVVGEPVVDVLAVSPPPNQTSLEEDLESLADGREALAALARELRDAGLTGVEPLEELQPRHVPRRAQERRSPLEGQRVSPRAGRRLWVVTLWIFVH